MPDSIFKFKDKPGKEILVFILEKIVRDQYKFWVGMVIGMILVLILS